ncbi:type II toxin-antitoxin system PrlF family antitoxin [Ideonella sp.]|uniref:type II toxin-antitoxin system PrlF family antitoxin n=1 Tax=Ideonella sp. TaxID=1929293 RepID=UPI0035B47314
MSHTSTLTRRGSTTIPRSIREALGVQLGDTLTWHVLPDGTVLCRHKPATRSTPGSPSCRQF